METKNPEEIRRSVRNRYGEIAKLEISGCGCGALSSCCGTSLEPIEKMSQAFGYTKEQIDSAPEGANMGLGCGNPQAIASCRCSLPCHPDISRGESATNVKQFRGTLRIAPRRNNRKA